MNEKKKLEEAKYFFSKMNEEQETRESFVFNLSAFLSATRSILQYALKEASQKSGGKNWYDKLMNSSPELKFFKDERNLNIHEEPTHPKAHYTLHAEIGSFVTTFGSVSMTVYDKDGDIKQQSQSETNSDTPKIIPNQTATTNPRPNKVKYFFDNWARNEDVLTLCQKCVRELENAIKDGISQGFITE
jgi:hypothetical protein